MNRNLFLLLLLLQSTFLFSSERKTEPIVRQIKDSIHFDSQSIGVFNIASQAPSKKIKRDSIQIKTIDLPKSLYTVTHSKSILKNYFDFSINAIKFKDPLKHIDNISFKYLLGELEIEAKSKENKNVIYNEI